MIPTKTINLDFWRYPTEVLNLVQGESAGRTLRFNLVDGTAPFDLTSATAAWFAVRKSDETVSLDNAVIIDAANGIVEVTFSSQSVAAAGDAIGEIQIVTAESLTKSFNIPINIQQSVDIDGISPSVSEFNVLNTLIGQAETVISIADTDLWPEVVANAEYFSDLAGAGRTTETVKGNANEIADHIADDENPHTVTLAQLGAAADADLTALAGAGRTTETVKGNADEIALKADQATTYTKTETDAALGLKEDKLLLTNLVKNGQFANVTEGVPDEWFARSLIDDLTINGNVMSFTGRGTTTEGNVVTNDLVPKNIKLYLAANVSQKSSGSVRMPSTTFPNIIADNRFLSMILATGETTYRAFVISATAGCQIEVSNPISINLTAAFGAGNEPTVAEMDAILAKFPNSWFDGTVDVSPTLVDLIDLAGADRTTETVKGNADEIAAIKDRASKLTKIYGVQFTGSNSVGVRTHDAVGMVANVGVDDQIVVNDFDDVSFFQRPRCLVYHDADGRAQVMAYEGEPDFSLTGAVFPPHTEKAQVFYEQKPFYWNGDLDWPQVTATPLEGFELAPMFKNPTDKVYLPSYWMSEDNGKACSLSGTYPTTTISINAGMASARTYHPRAHLETMDARICEYVLQLVEFATRDLQTVMMGAASLRYNQVNVSALAETGVNRIVMANASADGYVVGQTICIGTSRNGEDITPRVVITGNETLDASNREITFDGDPLDIPLGAYISSRVYWNGVTDIVKASSGSPVSNTSGKYPCIWRGKVDPWGMGYSGISDVLVQQAGTGTQADPYSYTPYRLPDPTLYDEGTIDSNWVEVGYKLESKEGYVTALGYDPKSPGVRLTTSVDGEPVSSDTNYFASYFYHPRREVSTVFVGGAWYVIGRCSPVTFAIDLAPTQSSVNRLPRLYVAPL